MRFSTSTNIFLNASPRLPANANNGSPSLAYSETTPPTAGDFACRSRNLTFSTSTWGLPNTRHTVHLKRRNLTFSTSTWGLPNTRHTVHLKRVRRTVYIDNLSPQVTAPVLKTALGQFGNVTDVQFIPNYTESRNIPQCALVEMETGKQARCIIEEMTNYPFMISGMPRPVRARAAEAEMFNDRPRKPGRHIHVRWIDRKDPDFEVAWKMKNLIRRHAAECSVMLKHQLEEEEKLAKHQAGVLHANFKKYDMMDGVIGDKTLIRLANRYDISINDD